MQVLNSDDISILKLPITFDLTGAEAVVKIANENTGANLGLVKLAFELYDPNGNPIHIGSLDTPDALGNFAGSFIFTEKLPIFDNGILWSGSPYKLIVKSEDSAGALPDLIQNINIFKPAGNSKVGKNYAEANLMVTVDCNHAEAKIIDATSYSYKGITGEVVSKKLTIISPADDTGTVPANVEYNGLSAVLHPLTFSGKGFQAVITSKIKYDLSNTSGDSFVIINYIKHLQFDVNCNYDICPLLSEFGRLIESAETHCDRKSEELIQKLSPKILNLVLAKQQATCGYDIGKMIDDIKQLAGWDCNCNCARTMGLNGVGSTIGGGLNVQFDTAGDITATADVTGNNVLIHIKDFTYIFKICDDTGSEAFTIVPVINGRTKTYCLKVNKTTLAEEIITIIKNDATLLQYFNSIIQVSGANIELTVDGKCIINTHATCDYVFKATLVDGVSYNLRSIMSDGVKKEFVIPFTTAAYINNIGALLSLQGQGTFISEYEPTTKVLTITAAENTHALSDLILYKIVDESGNYLSVSTTLITMDLEKTCAEIVPVNSNSIVQAIINYICNVSTANVRLNAPLTLCKINADGTTTSTEYSGSLYEYLQEQAAQFCRSIQLILEQKNISCEDIGALFVSNKPITALDKVYGSRSGECGPWTIEDLFKTIFSFIKTTNDQTIKNLWCDAINICNSSFQPCNAVTAGTAIHDGTNLNITFANNGAGTYRVGYRIYGTTGLFTEANKSADAGATTSVSYIVPANRYEVRIIAVCSGSESVPFLITSPKCPDVTEFNVFMLGVTRFATHFRDFIITYAVPTGVTKVNVVIDYPNGGSYNQMVTVTDPGFLAVQAPAGVFGTFQIKIRTVCNETNGWFGDWSNTITKEITEDDKIITFVTSVVGDPATTNFDGTNDLQVSSGPGAILNPYQVEIAASVGYILVSLKLPRFDDQPFENEWPLPANVAIISYTSILGDTYWQVEAKIATPATEIINFAKNEVAAAGECRTYQFGVFGADDAWYTIKAVLCDGTPYDSGELFVGDGAPANICAQMGTLELDGNVVIIDYETPCGGGEGEPLNAYWGWKGSDAVLSEADIELSPNTQIIVPTQDIICPFGGGVGTPQFLWMAEPIAATPKTKWIDMVNSTNNGDIGTGDDLFPAPVISGGYRFYITNYLTEQPNPIKFKIV